jgi:hypothetical protein
VGRCHWRGGWSTICICWVFGCFFRLISATLNGRTIA